MLQHLSPKSANTKQPNATPVSEMVHSRRVPLAWKKMSMHGTNEDCWP